MDGKMEWIAYGPSIWGEKDTAIVYFTIFFPWLDKETYDFYRLFEKEVYLSLEKWNW